MGQAVDRYPFILHIQLYGCCRPGDARSHRQPGPGARPTDDMSIEFVIRPKIAVMWFKIYLTDHNKMLHTSRQCDCRGVCKISL